LNDAIRGQFEGAWIFQKTIPRYKKMRMHGKRLPENCQKIPDNISTAAYTLRFWSLF